MGHTVAAFVARSNVRRIARQFIVGESAEEAAGKLESLWRAGQRSRDLLGEKTVSSEQADRYALATLFAPLSAHEGLAQAKERLRPILRLARELGAFINFDTEHYDVKDMTFRLLRELLDETVFASLEADAVVQAYLRDSSADFAELIEWSSGPSGL